MDETAETLASIHDAADYITRLTVAPDKSDLEEKFKMAQRWAESIKQLSAVPEPPSHSKHATAQIYGQDPLEFIRQTVEAIQLIDEKQRTHYLTGPVGHVHEMTPLEEAKQWAGEIDGAARLLERERGEKNG